MTSGVGTAPECEAFCPLVARGLHFVAALSSHPGLKLSRTPIDKVRRLNRAVGFASHTILISKTGKEFAIDDGGALICDVDGAIAGIVLVFRDVTHQRSLEAALRSNERLAVAGRLSASIAHEIHNPLEPFDHFTTYLDGGV
jgi:nitrogen-specific signal transduction histidine kinase